MLILNFNFLALTEANIIHVHNPSNYNSYFDLVYIQIPFRIFIEAFLISYTQTHTNLTFKGEFNAYFLHCTCTSFGRKLKLSRYMHVYLKSMTSIIGSQHHEQHLVCQVYKLALCPSIKY